MHPALRALALLALLTVTGCGTETITTFEDPATLHQMLDDSAPAESSFDPALQFTSRHGPENYSARRFRLDVGSFESEAEKAAAATLWKSHAALLQARPDAIPSVQTVSTAIKQLDDTIYAGVERAVQDGLSPTLQPKRAILSEAVAWLLDHRSGDADDAAVYAGAALALGGAPTGLPADLDAQAAAAKDQFLTSPRAKPIGFYTWSSELQGIWAQDRFLQTALPTSGASCAFAEAIAADPGRAARYAGLVALYGRLTNPVKRSLAALVSSAQSGACSNGSREPFLGVSRSAEDDLFARLYPSGVPPTADLMQDLIDAIRAGTVDLTPSAQDGWYAWQTWALETLLVTDKAEERAKAAFTARYKKRLQEAFQTMLVQHRETHAKQMGGSTLGASHERLAPEMRVEPLATVYVRHARGYVFLEKALEDVMGATLLDAGRAVEASGPETPSLRERIRRARDLYYGLYLVACQDLGLHPKLDAAGDPAPGAREGLAGEVDRWLAQLSTDALAAADVRVMVPIASLSETRSKYWAVIGVRSTLAAYSFIGGDGEALAKPDQTQRAFLPTEQFLEVESSSFPLSREELRALCDQEGTAEKIKAALEAR